MKIDRDRIANAVKSVNPCFAAQQWIEEAIIAVGCELAVQIEERSPPGPIDPTDWGALSDAGKAYWMEYDKRRIADFLKERAGDDMIDDNMRDLQAARKIVADHHTGFMSEIDAILEGRNDNIKVIIACAAIKWARDNPPVESKV